MPVPSVAAPQDTVTLVLVEDWETVCEEELKFGVQVMAKENPGNRLIVRTVTKPMSKHL